MYVKREIHQAIISTSRQYIIVPRFHGLWFHQEEGLLSRAILAAFADSGRFTRKIDINTWNRVVNRHRRLAGVLRYARVTPTDLSDPDDHRRRHGRIIRRANQAKKARLRTRRYSSLDLSDDVHTLNKDGSIVADPQTWKSLQKTCPNRSFYSLPEMWRIIL